MLGLYLLYWISFQIYYENYVVVFSQLSVQVLGNKDICFLSNKATNTEGMNSTHFTKTINKHSSSSHVVKVNNIINSDKKRWKKKPLWHSNSHTEIILDLSLM